MKKRRRQQLHPMTAARLSAYNAQYVSGYGKTCRRTVTAGRNHYGEGFVNKELQ